MVLLSLDISTSCIGISLFVDSKLLKIEFLNLKNIKGFNQKVDSFVSYVKDNYADVSIDVVVIELPTRNFRQGSSNNYTTMLLVAFNHAISYICRDIFNAELAYYSCDRARKLAWPNFDFSNIEDKKLAVHTLVANAEPQIEWFFNKKDKLMIQNFDMTDAYTIGLAYFNDDNGSTASDRILTPAKSKKKKKKL
jgi:hypothetical protein